MIRRIFIVVCLICAICGPAAAQRTNHKDVATGVHYAALENAATPQASLILCLQHVQAQGGGECDASGLFGSYTITSAIFAGVTNPVRLKLAGTWGINANLTVPANVTLDFQDGAELAVANGYTLIIQGHISGTPRFSGAGIKAIGTLTVAGVISDGETVFIDGLTYRLKTVMTRAFDVQLDASNTVTLAYLCAAINASGTPGVEYFAGTTVNLDVECTSSTATWLGGRARIAGWPGSHFETTETMANGVWGAGSLVGELVPVVFASPYIKEILPEWWGAKGDGTDDTLALQTALAVLRASTTARLRLGAGGAGTSRYLINDSLLFASAAHISGAATTFADGYPGTTIQMAPGIDRDIFRSWNAQSGNPSRFTHAVIIENLRLEAAATSTAGNGIWLAQCGEVCVIQNVYAYNFKGGGGVRLNGVHASAKLNQVSVHHNKYGLWLREPNGNISTDLLSGDDNEQLVYIDAAVGIPDLVLSLYNTKSETILEKHDPIILANNLHGARINIFGGALSTYSDLAITSYTDTTPVVLTVPGYTYLTGRQVRIWGTPAAVLDGRWTITQIDASTFSLNGSTAVGAGTGGYVRQVKSAVKITGSSGQVSIVGIRAARYEYLLEDTTVSPTYFIPNTEFSESVNDGTPGTITYRDNGRVEFGQLTIYDRATGAYLPGIGGLGVSKQIVRMGVNQGTTAPWELQLNDGTPVGRWDYQGHLRLLDRDISIGAGNIYAGPFTAGEHNITFGSFAAGKMRVSLGLDLTAGKGYLDAVVNGTGLHPFYIQASPLVLPNAGGGSTRFGDATNYFQFAGAPTGAQIITFPDASGTVALGGHAHAGGDITSGTVDAARLPTLRAGVLAAFCGGGFPGGSAVYMPGYGGASSVSYCTLTTETSGMPAPFAATAKALYVKVGTAGCCAGSGIVRLRVNGANTALTCTVGTGTACSDVAHTASIAAGDIVTISVATGSPEVLADMNITIGLWQ